MTTLMKVARFHFQVDRITTFYVAWGVLVFDFLVNLVIAAQISPTASKPFYTGALASIYVILSIVGAVTIVRTLPLGLVLGISRRSFYGGTVLLAAVLAVVYGLALTLLYVFEQASDGWGLRMHFFRVPYLFAGPWYLTWLTSTVGLALVLIPRTSDEPPLEELKRSLPRLVKQVARKMSKGAGPS